MSSTDASGARHQRRELALATWGLFTGLAFLMLAAGLFATLLGVRSERSGLPAVVSSIIAASYYVGFLIGSRLTLSGLGRVGHIRVYTALASVLAAAIAAVGITDSAVAWTGLRLVTGLCTAGIYVVAESWLNDQASNENRGRLLALYGALTILFYGLGQMMLTVFDDNLVMGFAVAGLLTSLAVAPVALSESAAAPSLATTEKLSLKQLAGIVPTGVVSCFLVGVANGALAGMGAVYATRVGMGAAAIGLFVALPSLGGVLLQWPISMASDDLDRRAVGLACSALAAVVAGLLLLGGATEPMAFVLVALLGGLSYPQYSIAAAYTNDWVDPDYLSAVASQLITLYGLGAVVGPLVAGMAMGVLGADGYYWSIVVLNALLAVFFFYRMLAWRAPLAKRPWSEVSLPARAFFIPATIISMGLRRHRRRRTA